MNVLFVGDWDIAGAYIADRLMREGHEACWMTGEGTSTLWNKKLKGNIYRGTWRREDYMRILKAHSIDVVIFLTGEFREHYEELPEYESQMAKFTSLMNVLRNYPIKCLLYLSSLELDYGEIHTPMLTDLAAGEMLCQAYHNAYGIPVLILRMGCVYGSYGIDHMGYTGRLLMQMKQGKRLESLYSPEDRIDAIYGEDVAVAVKNLLELGKLGLYRLSTGHPLTMQEYYRCLGRAVGIVPKVNWQREKHTASERFFRSENQIKKETGWIPFYLLEEKGIGKLKEALKQCNENERKEEKRKYLENIKKALKYPALREIVETLLLFVLTCFFLRLGKDVSDLKYVDIRLMFVALVSCQYGIGMGTLSVVLACASYIYSLMSAQVDVSYLLYSVDTWIPFIAYIITGSVIGYIVNRQKDENETMKEKYSLLSDKYDFLKMIHGETLEVKGNLQRQIITSNQSFENAYEVAVELDSLKPELILFKVISVLEHIMECDKTAIFLINSEQTRFARLKACSTGLRESLPNSIDLEEYNKIGEAFQNSEDFVNMEFLPGYPDYAAPIYYQGKIYGFVAVYEVGPDKFTVYYQNLFKMITSLIEKNLVKALEYEDARKDELYYAGTELLYPKALKERIQIMDSGKEEVSYTYLRGKVYVETPMEMEEAAQRIGSVIRGSDFMGIDDEGDYTVILTNMSLDALDLVQERFRRKGLTLEVEKK